MNITLEEFKEELQQSLIYISGSVAIETNDDGIIRIEKDGNIFEITLVKKIE